MLHTASHIFSRKKQAVLNDKMENEGPLIGQKTKLRPRALPPLLYSVLTQDSQQPGRGYKAVLRKEQKPDLWSVFKVNSCSPWTPHLPSTCAHCLLWKVPVLVCVMAPPPAWLPMSDTRASPPMPLQLQPTRSTGETENNRDSNDVLELGPLLLPPPPQALLHSATGIPMMC